MNGLGVLSYEAFPPQPAALDAGAAAIVAAVLAGVGDAVLARSLAGGADGGRSVRDALRSLRNRVTVNKDTGAVTIYAEDDTTPAWSATATFESRNAVSDINPA